MSGPCPARLAPTERTLHPLPGDCPPVISAQDESEKRKPRDTTHTPLTFLCSGRTRSQNFRLYRFRPLKRPRQKTPPVFWIPKKFKTKNPTWVAGGVGLEPWQLGMVPADPWPRGKITPGQNSLSAPFRGRGGAVSGPQRRRFIFPGEGLGTQFRVPVLPAGKFGQEKGDDATHRFWRQPCLVPHP